MANAAQMEYRAKIQEMIQNNTQIAAGRRAAFVSAIGLIAGRVLLFIAETWFLLANAYSFPVMTAVMVGISILFGLGIYNGVKPLAALALLGGFLSVFSAVRDGVVLAFLQYGTLLAKIYAIAFIIAMITTFVPTVYLLLSANYRTYADCMAEAQKELAAKQKRK